MTSRVNIVYLLECDHKVVFPASFVGGSLWCLWCHDRRAIYDVIVREWRAKCNACRFARWAGMSRETADMFANAHIRHNNPRHTVEVRIAVNPDAVKTKEKFDAWQLRTKS